MSIKLIAAVDKNYAIGYKNKLLFHIHEDLKRFKELTEGHYVLMGRKTYESLPNGALDNRTNIVLTHNKKFVSNEKQVIVEHDINKILNHYLDSGKQDKDLWVIGGSEIYKQFFPYADEVWLTYVAMEAEKTDAWFPFEKLYQFDFELDVNACELRYSNELDCGYAFVKYVPNGRNQEVGDVTG